MNTGIIQRIIGVFVIVFLVVMAMVQTTSAVDSSNLMVGRVYHVEGLLLRYVSEENDWVAAVRDAPLSTGDTLYTGRKGMAELMVPNGTWVRIADNTQIQFIGLDPDVSEIDIAAGVSRFFNRDSGLVIKATSPFGYVLVYPGSIFDYYVGENSAEIVPIKGRITFVHNGSNTRYEVYPGNPSILADQYRVSTGEGEADPDWEDWNRYRDSFWTAKNRIAGSSVQYLPASLHHDAYVFEENGRWERVYYEGSDRWFWQPTRVPPDWAPFTVGRWTEWYGDQTWIPSEPFGYVTHHYGNWIFAGGRWYWAPPVTNTTAGLPLLNIGFFWNPGRVSWIYSGGYVGWVPLAPRETYYSHYKWGGPHVVRVTNINITQINIYPRNYAYAGHAVVVSRHNLYAVNNYRPVRVTNIHNTTIINNYRAAPVVNNTVIKDYSSTRQRYNFAEIHVKEKPHKTVVERIEKNQRIIQREKIEKVSVMDQRVKIIEEGKINRDTRIQQPKVTNYIVPASEMDRPKAEIKLQQKEIKKRDAREVKAEQEEPVKASVKPERQFDKQDQHNTKPDPKTGKSDKVQAVTPKEPVQEFERRMMSEKPSGPAPKPEVVSPTRQAPLPEGQTSKRPAPKPEAAYPAKPGHPLPKPEMTDNEKNGNSGAKTERVNPVKPGRPVVKPDGVVPQPSSKPENVKPARPGAHEKPEGVMPVQPTSKKEGTRVWL